MTYVFPGATKFIDDAAADAGLSPDERDKARKGWHLKQAMDALADLGRVVAAVDARTIDPETVADVQDRIARIRAGLAVQLAAVDAAAAEVYAGLGLAGPEPEPKKGARRARS